MMGEFMNWKCFLYSIYIYMVVCCYNNESGVFLVRYFMGAALLVIIHILHTQKWAAGYNPPLRSGRHTMIEKFINNTN